MGAHDAEEMLEAAKADAVILERTIADLQDRLNTIAEVCTDAEKLAALYAPEEEGSTPTIDPADIRAILDRRQSDARGVFLRDHDAHEIAAAIRAGQTEPMSAHGEDVVSRMERA